MNAKTFVDTFQSKKFMNTKTGLDEKSEYLKKELEIKTYIPFRQKREIIELVVAQNITEVNGVKKYDSINGYISFVLTMIATHTNLSFSEDPIADYDLLAESGLLLQIITEFRESYDEGDALLKMALASELEDNNINAIVAKFLYGILDRLDGVGEILKENFGNINLKEILGANFKEEDLAKLSSFLDKYNK